MKVMTLLFALAVLAVSACQGTSPFEVSQDDQQSLQTAGQTASGKCDPDASPC